MYVIKAKYFDRRKRINTLQKFVGRTRWEAEERKEDWEQRNRDAQIQDEVRDHNEKRR